MAGARSAGRMPFMSASTLNRRSAALYGAEPDQLSTLPTENSEEPKKRTRRGNFHSYYESAPEYAPGRSPTLRRQALGRLDKPSTCCSSIRTPSRQSHILGSCSGLRFRCKDHPRNSWSIRQKNVADSGFGQPAVESSDVACAEHCEFFGSE